MKIKIGDREVEVRKISIGDLSEAKMKLAQDKLKMVGNMASAELVAAVITQPISNTEVGEFVDSLPGISWFLTRCIVDKIKPVQEQIDAVVMASDPQVRLWLQASFPNPK